MEIPEAYELASIIVSLTPYGSTRLQESEYADEVRRHFEPFADHPVISTLDIATDADWISMYGVRENAYAYCFDDENEHPDRLIHCQPFSHVWGQLANEFSANRDLVEDFARQSGFRDFFAGHQDYYDAVVDEFRATAPVKNMKDWLEARFDNRVNQYRIVFSPLTGGWHSTQGFSDGDFVITAMFIEPVLDLEPERDFVRARILFTEIDHNYVNRVSDDYTDALNSAAAFGDGDAPFWADRESLSGYSSGYSVFNEYMTWAVFELWARDHYEDEATLDAVTEHMSDFMPRRGFPHYDAFRDELFRLYDAAGTGAPGEPVRIGELYPALLNWAEAYRTAHPPG